MNVQIQAVHFEADNRLLEHVNRKIEKLSTFHDKIIGVEVYLVLDNIVHNIKDKVAEIKVYVPKHSFFVKHQSKTFEESFDLAFDSMVNRIKRQKQKAVA
ncbi:MAG: 30S ribosomal protein S30 [Bacteroidetes bacterium 43-93]|jgi:putative sigma-54 modulation protein|nr:ribosome-associated translation inhibitor RaiA [Bacteroidota bacterium]OJW97395.1 MAG: 30S ribosomal protein S30 [Bacteroidetes bacterium 43-93]